MEIRVGLYWRLFWKFRALHLQRAFEYRADFFFWAGISLMWTIFNVFFFDAITQVSGHIGSWNRMEMLALQGTFTMLDAFTWSFFYHNMQAYTNGIFSGELNRSLTLPVDTQFLIMTSSNNYSNIFRFLTGLGLFIWATQRTPFQPGIGEYLFYCIIFGLSLLLIYFFWFSCSTCAFWVEKLDNINEIIPSLRRAWQIPREIFTGIASTIFTVLLPMGIIASVPTEIIIGRPTWTWTSYLVLATIVVILFSRRFFSFSVQRFAGMAN